MNIQLGFSTGTLYRHHNTSDSLIAFTKAGIKAVELGFVKKLDISWMKSVKKDELVNFEYVSLHAPKFEYAKNQESINILQQIKEFHKKVRNLDMVVFHPDPIKDFSVLNEVEIPIGIENMDNRKQSFQTAEEILDILSQFPNFKMILDVNHIYSNDHSMDMINNFYKLLGDKIAEIHLSGYAGYHEPLSETKQNIIFESIQNLNIPIIVEGVLSPEDIAKEKTYILELAQAA